MATSEKNDLRHFLMGSGIRSDQNITDALFAIADALNRIARQEHDFPLMGETLSGLTDSVAKIAEAIDDRNGS